jgi:hypothetical protein
MHEMQSAFRRLQWQVDKPGCEAEDLFSDLFFENSGSEDSPIQVSRGHHVWLRDIKSRIAGNENRISRLRIEISAHQGMVWDHLARV